MKTIVDYCIKAAHITKRIQDKSGKKLEDFIKLMPEDEEIKQLGEEVKTFAKQFPMPGL